MIANIRLLVPALLALMATVLPASASPRDDVMSGAFRCAVIGDTRLWLDCYYGAAQPVRAALGMQAAPTAQMKLVSAPPAGRPSQDDVGPRGMAMSEAFRCNASADDRQWLACFYAAAQPVRARLGLSPARPATAQTARAAPPPQFGLRQPQPAAQADHVAARMTSYTFNKYGIFTATLDNGQVWRQVSGDTSFARWNEPAAHYAVSISRGLLNSYKFHVKSSPGVFQVRRVQ